MARQLFLSSFLLLLLAITGLHCSRNFSIKGVAFITDMKGTPFYIGQKRAVLYRAVLPERVLQCMKLKDKERVRYFSRTRARLSDRADDLLIASGYSDLFLPESLRLEEWCRQREDSFQQKIGECRSWQAGHEKERRMAEKSVSEAAGNYRKLEALKRESHGLAQQNLKRGTELKYQQEEARKEAVQHLTRFKHYQECADHEYEKGKQYLGDAALVNQCNEKIRQYSAQAQSARQTGMEAMAAMQRLAEASARCFKESQEQEQQSAMYGIKMDIQKETLDARQQLLKAYDERLGKVSGKKLDLEKNLDKFIKIEAACLAGMNLGDFTAKGFSSGPMTAMLRELGAQCGLKKTTDIPRWYNSTRQELQTVFDENKVTETMTGADGVFVFPPVPDDTYYLLIEGTDSSKEEIVLVRRVDARDGRKILVSDDYAYQLNQWGFLRNGLSLFLGKGE